MNLDQIHATPFQESNCSTFLGVFRAHPERPVSWCIVQNRSGGDDMARAVGTSVPSTMKGHMFSVR
jgi:hypothetical protein